MGDRYIDAFRGSGIDDELMEKGLDIEYLTHIPNASVAHDALDLIMNPAAVALLGKHHTEPEINQIKRAIFRACITHDVPLPSAAAREARLLGVIVP